MTRPFIPRPRAAQKFPSGNVVVHDKEGKNIPELQGVWTLGLECEIRRIALPECEYHGF